MLTLFLISLFVIIGLFILSSLPLYFSVKLMNGKITLLKAVFVSIMIGIIVSAINLKFKLFGAIISFILTIWLYHEIFRLKWHKAFLVWLLQFIFIAIFYTITFLLTLTFIGLNILF